MALFDKKNFNAEVFGAYVDSIDNLNRNELLKSGAIVEKTQYASMLPDQVGGNYITVPIKARIAGTADNYDGSTNITSDSRETYTHGRIVVGRAHGWTERDFSSDVTGEDFLPAAQEVAEYWDDKDQDTLIKTLEGVFKMSDEAGAAFVNDHTLDISASVGEAANFGASTLNNAIQKALGDNKRKFSLAVMHSQVATNLENLQLMEYGKYTDEQGIQRDVALGTLNGRTVLVDDNMPTESVVGTQGVYTLKVDTAPTAGDKLEIFGVEYTWAANGTTPTATNLVMASTNNASNSAEVVYNKLNALTSGVATKYTITRSTDTLTFTQKSGSYGYHKPAVTVTTGESGTFAVAVSETTASAEYTKYTSYILGDGAIEYTNCGVKVPYEMDRDPATNGGQDTLYSRQRKVFAPVGISFVGSGIVSPTEAQLATGSNWKIANSNAESGAVYFPSKAIPIARVISKG